MQEKASYDCWFLVLWFLYDVRSEFTDNISEIAVGFENGHDQ